MEDTFDTARFSLEEACIHTYIHIRTHICMYIYLRPSPRAIPNPIVAVPIIMVVGDNIFQPRWCVLCEGSVDQRNQQISPLLHCKAKAAGLTECWW